MEKNIFLYLILFILGLQSCTTTSFIGEYIYNLKKVNKTVNDDDINVDKSYINNMSFSDSIINIVWSIDKTSLKFNLLNKTNNILTIDWNNAVYIDALGETNKVIHGGIKYIDRNGYMTPSIIYKNAWLTDIIIPTNNIYYENYTKYSNGGWRIFGLLINDVSNKNLIINSLSTYKIKSNEIIIPITYKNMNLTYRFVFNIKDINIKETQIYNPNATMFGTLIFSSVLTLLVVIL